MGVDIIPTDYEVPRQAWNYLFVSDEKALSSKRARGVRLQKDTTETDTKIAQSVLVHPMHTYSVRFLLAPARSW